MQPASAMAAPAGIGSAMAFAAQRGAGTRIKDDSMIAQAVSAPRVHHQWLPDRLNVERQIAAETGAALEQRGHGLREQNSLGVVQAIRREGAELSGAADPRK